MLEGGWVVVGGNWTTVVDKRFFVTTYFGPGFFMSEEVGLRCLGGGWTGVGERRIGALQAEVGRMLEGGWAVVGRTLDDD